MGDRLAFLLVDGAGAPVTGATPTFTDYRDRSGNARTPPAIVELGGGEYGFTPSDDDEATGVAFLITSGGSAIPGRFVGSISKPNTPFAALLLENASTGALWAGAAPTFGRYTDFSATPRTPPSLVAVSGAYLWCFTPSAEDAAVDIAYRVDAPAGAWPAYYAGSFTTTARPFLPDPSPNISPENTAVQHLREYLLRVLPSKMAQVNALRAAVLKSAQAEPFVITTGMKLTLTSVSREDAGVEVDLPVGPAITAAAVASAINAEPVPGLTASADSDGRLVLTSDTPPIEGTPSFVGLKPETVAGSNGAFGWDAGGDRCLRAYITPPGAKSVCDGWPAEIPDMGRCAWIVIGDRSSSPVPPDIRRNEHEVELVIEVLYADRYVNVHRTREGIGSLLRCIREVLTTTEGRQFGRAGQGDVVFSAIRDSRISGVPLRFANPATKMVEGTFDAAALTVVARVHHRPAS